MTKSGSLEQAILLEFSKLGLRPTCWSNGPGYRYGVHQHPTRKLLFVSQGSITFRLLQGAQAEDRVLHPGSRLDLPAGTPHSAVVGPQGVTCWEAHLPEGA